MLREDIQIFLMNRNPMLFINFILVKVSIWFRQVKQVVCNLVLGMK